MPGRVFVTGGSGFVGSAVIGELLSRGYTVNALAHHGKIRSSDERVRTIAGSFFKPDALDEGVRGCDAVIHLVGIIFEKPARRITFERIHIEGTRNVVDAVVRGGLKRYVHMSALGSRSGAVSNYHKTKFAAEEYVRSSSLDWTIFRPSLIHGPGGEFMQMEARWARRTAPPFLFMPYFGAGAFGSGGAGKLQPVYIKDVARAFVDSVDNRKTIGEVYPVGGSQRLSWRQFHETSATAIVGNKRLVLPMPVWVAKLNAAVLPAKLLGFNRDQVIMSQEDNTADVSKFIGDFGWTPQPFDQSLQSYAREM